MTVRTQIFLVVAPLFFACGVVGAAVSWRLQTASQNRAFEEEVRGFGIALAEFTEPADVAALRQHEGGAANRLKAVTERLNRWNLIKRLVILEARSGIRLADTAPDDGPPPAPADWRGLTPGELRLLPIRRSASGEWRQPFLSLGAGGMAIVGGEISAEQHLAARSAILRDASIDAGVAALIGLGVGLGVASFVSRQIRRLRLPVETIGTPAFPTTDVDSVVEEVADLRTTMEVMHGVLVNTVQKTRSLLLEGERYRNEQSLAAAFQTAFLPPATLAVSGAECAWFAVGEDAPAPFAGMISASATAGAAFVGMAGSAGRLESVVRARAAAAYLRDTLSRQPLDRACADACRLFGLGRLAAATWAGERLSGWSSERAAPDRTGAPLEWAPGHPVVLCGLGPINRERVRVYLANFPSHAPARIAAEVPVLLDRAEPGAALVLLRRDPAA